MAGRRVRWRNVARVACLAAAGVLIATHGPDRQRPARPAPPRPAAPRAAGAPPPVPPVVRLPPLRDIPRLVLPRPRERRALKGEDSGGGGGPPSINRVIRGQVTKPPGDAGGERAAG